MGKVVGIYLKKGGTGKTHACFHLPAQMACDGKRVLVIDGDPQRNTTQALLATKSEYFGGLNVKEDIPTLFTLLSDKINIYNCIINLEFSAKRKIQNRFKKITCKFDLIPGSLDLDYLEINDANRLKDELKVVKDNYDYIFIDFPPATNDLTVMYLVACDYILSPCEVGMNSSMSAYIDVIHYCEMMKSSGANSDLEILGYYYNKVMDYKQKQKETFEEMNEKKTELRIFDSTIRYAYGPTDKALNDYNQPFCVCLPHEKITEDYKKLAKEIYRTVEIFEKEKMNK